jgi:hypothetical protein
MQPDPTRVTPGLSRWSDWSDPADSDERDGEYKKYKRHMVGPFRKFLMTRRFKQLGRALLVLIAGSTGCLHCFHPTPEPAREQVEAAKQIPTPAKGGVYLFLLNGLDPLEIGNLSGVREYVNCLGFGKVYYGQIYHSHWFLDEMRRIRSECPESRFIVLGYEHGAEAAKKLVGTATGEGIEVDELIYLEPKGVGPSAVDAASGCRRVLTIQSSRWFGHPSAPAGSESIVIPHTSLYGIPTHPVVLEILVSQMQELAGTIPLVAPIYPDNAILFGLTPTPRTVANFSTETNDEWDFLKPGRSRIVVTTSEKFASMRNPKKD